jgi:hypothetical protein
MFHKVGSETFELEMLLFRMSTHEFSATAEIYNFLFLTSKPQFFNSREKTMLDTIHDGWALCHVPIFVLFEVVLMKIM